MKILKYILLLCAILFTLNSMAGIENLKTFYTTDLKLNINQIITKKYNTSFCDTSKCKFEAAKVDGMYWLYFELNNEKYEPLMLEMPMFFYNIHVYFFTENMQLVDSSTIGYQLNINKRKYKTSANTVQVPMNQRLKCYIQLQTSFPSGLSVLSLKNSDFTNQKLEEHNYNGIINGIFLLAIIYSAFFAIILQSRIYLFYMFYVISFWVFMQSINHVTPMYFSWLNIPFTLGFYIVPHYLTSIFLILYSNELLQLSSKLPVYSIINKILVVILILLLILFLTTGIEWKNSNINNLTLVPSFLSAAILIYRRYNSAWFVFIGITLIYIASISVQFNFDWYLPLFFVFPFYGILEIIIFGISITYWIKILFIEKNKATQLALNAANELTIIKENQNMLLEKEVAIKTHELAIANKQLEKYVQKVESLNVDLEKDNNSLKVEVIGQITARSEDKIMNFNEFKISFPDEQSCYNRLEQLKWNKDYVCKKCNNTKFLAYKETDKNTKRRCSSCGFIETTTSLTLFHNIKFPIQKAFYLTYAICSKKTKTLEELSNEIGLRTATIHAFSKRVKEAVAATKLGKKHKDSWTHILLYNAKVKNNQKTEITSPEKK